MAPKAQRLNSCDLNSNLDDNHNQCTSEKEVLLKRNQEYDGGIHSSSLQSGLRASTSIQLRLSKQSITNLMSLLSDSISNAVSHAMVGAIIAMPIAVRYPLIQLIMFLTIIIGTSPLYFILITFVKNNNSNNNNNKRNNSHQIQNNQSQIRPQPSIIGSISPILSAE